MKCTKFIIRDVETEKTYVLVGLLIEEDEGFYHIRTSKKKYTISKSLVLKVEQLDELFKGYSR